MKARRFTVWAAIAGCARARFGERPGCIFIRCIASTRRARSFFAATFEAEHNSEARLIAGAICDACSDEHHRFELWKDDLPVADGKTLGAPLDDGGLSPRALQAVRHALIALLNSDWRVSHSRRAARQGRRVGGRSGRCDAAAPHGGICPADAPASSRRGICRAVAGWRALELDRPARRRGRKDAGRFASWRQGRRDPALHGGDRRGVARSLRSGHIADRQKHGRARDHGAGYADKGAHRPDRRGRGDVPRCRGADRSRPAASRCSRPATGRRRWRS